MKLARVLIIASALFACFPDDRLQWPTSPPDPVAPPIPPAAPPPAPNVGASLRIMIIDASGACIHGATVSVIRGQALGRSATQEQPCSVWSYGDDGAVLRDLAWRVEMTVIISATGYVAQELTATPPSVYEVELVPVSK